MRRIAQLNFHEVYSEQKLVCPIYLISIAN